MGVADWQWLSLLLLQVKQKGNEKTYLYQEISYEYLAFSNYKLFESLNCTNIVPE